MIISFNVDNTREAIKELELKDYPLIPAPGGGKTRPLGAVNLPLSIRRR